MGCAVNRANRQKSVNSFRLRAPRGPADGLAHAKKRVHNGAMSQLGLTHVAFAVRDLAGSIAFYAQYASMQVVHERRDQATDGQVAWLSDGTRPFVIVLVQSKTAKDTPLGPFGHLGVALSTRAEVDRLARVAREHGCLLSEPTDSGPPVGYWALLSDPDGNTLELSHGQHIIFAPPQDVAKPL